MAYQSLYRRYRPRQFAEVRGQARMVDALRNAVREDRVGHAYLLSGPRGTGKTTTARILAKALNCEHLHDGEPCGTCPSCVAIDAGTSFDLHELDAASNRGINEIRDLLSTIALGSAGRTKVYILDEVHMLTKEASAALLKTLEEPPSHVVFVLATTDPQKVLPTIRSRTQHFQVHLLPATDLRELVEFVIADAELTVDEEGIDHALRAGAGSARDTLSALETVVAAGGSFEVEHHVEMVMAALVASDPGAVLAAVAQSIEEGREPRLVGEELIAELRNGFLVSMGVGLAHAPDADIARARHLAKTMVPATLTRSLEAIGEALVDMRNAADARIPLEVALVRLCQVDADMSPAALLERIERLERQVRSGGVPDAGPRTAPSGGRPADRAREELARQRVAAGEDDAASAAEPRREAADAAPATEPAARPATAAPAEPAAASDAAPTGRAALGALRGGGRGRGRSAPTPDVETTPVQAAPAAAAPTSAASLPDDDALVAAWTNDVLPTLPARVRSRFAAGRIVGSAAGRVQLALPNEPHRTRCEEYRADVEAALGAHLGRDVTVELIVDSGRAEAPSDAASDEPVPAAVDDPGQEDVGPLEDLMDAGTGDLVLERIEQHFPGAEEVAAAEADGP